MCLELRADYDMPFNDGRLRWKSMVGDPDIGLLKSEYYAQRWVVGVWYDAVNNDSRSAEKHDIGFHVLLEPESSVYGLHRVQVEVEGFVASGTWGGMSCETWKRARVVTVLDDDDNDITEQFKPKKEKE